MKSPATEVTGVKTTQGSECHGKSRGTKNPRALLADRQEQAVVVPAHIGEPKEVTLATDPANEERDARAFDESHHPGTLNPKLLELSDDRHGLVPVGEPLLDLARLELLPGNITIDPTLTRLKVSTLHKAGSDDPGLL